MNRAIQILYFLARMFSIPLFNVLTLTIGIHLFGKENWGTYINISIWVFLVAFLAKWAGQNHIVKEMSQNPSKLYSIFFSNLIERSIILSLTLLLFIFTSWSVALASTVLVLLIFIYNSLENLMVYFQKFKLQNVIEIIGFLTLLLGLHSIKGFKLELVIYAFSLSYFVRILIAIFVVRLPKTKLQINFGNLYITVPFFLIGFSGWLSTKIDLYIVSYYFSKGKLADYQLFISCFLMVQSLSGLALIPFYKHLYRLPHFVIDKINRNLRLLALPLVGLATLLIWMVLEKYYSIGYPVLYYLLAACACLASFFYSVTAFQLYRNNKEKKMALIGFFTIGIQSLITLLLIQSLDVLGVLLSILIVQWLYLFLINRETKKLNDSVFSNKT
ncbi:MAG: hypothetical protein J0L86_16015 [Flavobacteriales bacterium]|nr:hypothetical protein [Flavobacteriales bacterium]